MGELKDEVSDSRGYAPPDNELGYVPFEAGVHHQPSYYRARVPVLVTLAEADWGDVAHAWGLPPFLALALKYIQRHGRKPGESAAQAITKSMEMHQRQLSLEAQKEEG